MSDVVNTRVVEAQRRTLYACEVVVSRRLHMFGFGRPAELTNQIAMERKEMEAELRTLRRKLPKPPAVTDELIEQVARQAVAGADPDPAELATVKGILLALAAIRPDMLLSQAEVEDDEADE